MNFATNQKSHPGLISQYFHFVSSIRIQWEKEYVNLGLIAQNAGETIFYMQIFSFFLQEFEKDYNKREQLIDILSTLCQYARPYSFFNHEQTFFHYSFLIPLATIMGLQMLLFWIRLSFDQKNYTVIRHLEQYNNITKLFIRLYVIMSVAFEKLFFIPFLEVSAISLKISLNNISLLPVIFFSGLTMLIIILIQTIQLIFYTPNLFQLNFGKFNASILNYFETFLITFVIIFSITIEGNKLQILGILIGFFNLSRLVGIYKNYDKFYGQNKYELILFSFTSVLAGLCTFGDLATFNSFNIKRIILITLYICPLLSLVLIKQLSVNHIQVMMNTQAKIEKQQYKIMTLNQYLNKQKSQIPQLILILINKNNYGFQNKQNKQLEILTEWINEENERFYRQILQIKEQSIRLRYYLRFLRFDYTLSVNQIKINVQIYKEFQTMLSLNPKGTIQNSDRATDLQFSSEVFSKTQIKKNKLTAKELQFKNLNFFEEQKLQIVKESTQTQFNHNQYTKEQDQVELAVKSFLQFEENNKNLIDRIIQGLQLKIQFQQDLFDGKFQTNQFGNMIDIIQQFKKIEKKFLKQYFSFPSRKIQTYLVFYYSEIQNNYMLAYKYQNLISIADENLMKLSANQTINLYSDDLNYIIVRLQDETQKLLIESYSKKLNHLLNKKDKSQKFKYIESVLPKGFDSIHSELMQQFFLTGYSKFFRQANMAFFQSNKKYMTQVKLFFDQVHNAITQNTYIVFIKELDNQDPVILVANNFKIINITIKIAEIFGIQTKYAEQLASFMRRQLIIWFIPQFKSLFDDNYISETVQIQSFDTQFLMYKNSAFIQKELQQQMRMEEKFHCDLNVTIRQSNKGTKFYIIQILKWKAFIETETGWDQTDVPAEDSPKVFNQRSLLKNSSMVNMFSRRQRSLEIIPEITVFSSPKDEQQILFPTDAEQKNNNLLPSSYLNRESLIFSRDDVVEIEEEDVEQSEIRKESEHSILEKNFTVYQTHLTPVKSSEKEQAGSKASSGGGIRKTRYFKKYEQIQKYIEFSKGTKQLDIYFALMTMLVVLGSIQSILYIEGTYSDLNLFLTDLNMIQMKSHFLGPIDQYTLCLNALLNPITLVQFQQITAEQQIYRIRYSQYEMGKIFDDLKRNYIDLINNPQVSRYLQNQQIIVNMKNNTDLEQKQISFHEALILILESSYNFKLISPTNLTSGFARNSYFVYIFSNYIQFHEQFHLLNLQILEASLARSDYVFQKWILIFYPCFILCIMLLFVSELFYYMHIKNQQKIIQLFKFTITPNLQTELERLRVIQKLIKKDQHILYQYKFDIYEKEKQLSKIISLREKLDKFNKKKIVRKSVEQTNINNLIRVYRLLITNAFVLVIIFAIYFLFIFLNFYQPLQYVSKYPRSAVYFNDLSDLVIASSETFVSKQFVYQIDVNLWYFFNESHIDSFVVMFNMSNTLIQQFLAQKSRINSQDYLITDYYIKKQESMMNEDVCLQIDEVDLVSWYCDEAFGGSLRRGYQAGAATIVQANQNEYAYTNGFRIVYLTKDVQLEAGLIMSQAINKLQEQYHSEINSITKNLCDQTIIFSGMYFAFIAPMTMIFLYYLRKFYRKQFQICLKFICLLPQLSLFLDSSIDRQMKQMVMQFEIL